MELPYATGKDRFLGHRIIGASAFLGRGISSVILTRTIGSTGTMSLHCSKSSGKGPPGPIHCGKLSTGMAISNDDCKSLGKWPSVLGPNDYLIDTNCYFLPRMAAVVSSPVWYRRFREPNTLDADRAIVHLLRAQNADYDSSRRYSVNYVSKTPLSLYAGISS
jgi:hypothetical protein